MTTTPGDSHETTRNDEAAAPAPGGDAAYEAGVRDLLGVLALGELTAFNQLAADAQMAPDSQARAALSRMSVQEFEHYEELAARIEQRGGSAEEAMAPFREAFDAFHERTRPSNWLEGLVKAYVGDGIARDFYREISAYVDDETRELITRVVADTGAEFIVPTLRKAMREDPKGAARLALWARRIVGEAIAQAQHVAVDRDELSSLIVGSPDRPGADLAELGRVFARLADNHTQRMVQLGFKA